ncbi:MAG: hypothetical protein OXF02_01940 [Simkaniaceae bacterium]|nr:hypothetical protein [Simkaniaceae bacterium]
MCGGKKNRRRKILDRIHATVRAEIMIGERILHHETEQERLLLSGEFPSLRQIQVRIKTLTTRLTYVQKVRKTLMNILKESFPETEIFDGWESETEILLENHKHLLQKISYQTKRNTDLREMMRKKPAFGYPEGRTNKTLIITIEKPEEI